jgi:hypothetical protein
MLAELRRKMKPLLSKGRACMDRGSPAVSATVLSKSKMLIVPTKIPSFIAVLLQAKTVDLENQDRVCHQA